MVTDAYEALTDGDRLHIVSVMLESNGAVTIDDIVESKDASENDRQSWRLELYHHHLPKLEDTGVLEYDWAGGDIELNEQVEGLGEVLEAYQEEDAIAVRSP